MPPVASAEVGVGRGFAFPPHPNVRVLGTATGRLGAVMAPAHALAQRTPLRLSECVGYPLIVADKSMAIHPHLSAAFTPLSLDPPLAIETNSIEVMRHAAMS